MENIYFEIEPDDDGIRLDKYLSGEMQDLSRSYIQKLIKDDEVYVNGRAVKANYKLSAGDRINVKVPDPEILDIEAEDIPLDILYEDDDLIFINKPKGMVVHPAPGHYSGTLVNALMFHCRDNLSGINGILRPGIVHRIDMDTTGVIVACKNDYAHQKVAEQLLVHSINREYEAICVNNFKESGFCGTVDAPINRSKTDRKRMTIDPQGRRAVTHYTVLDNYKGYSHILCTLETGRTHQIRVHMASIGHPLLGDCVYGPDKCQYKLQGQTLHARKLGLIHPRTGQYIEVTADRPEYFEHLLNVLPRG